VKHYRAYVDTSVFGGTQDKDFQLTSESFFREVAKGRFLVLVSPIILDELKAAPRAVQQVLETVPGHLLELIAVDDQVKQLANAYLEAKILTKKSNADAHHVAAATIARADLIVSWNFKHIVNFDRIKKFNGINLIEGYGIIDIRSPLEVVHVKEK
jgi:predicted nucleic acid-binding protein